jgi:protein-disulfide isomerase
VCIFPAVLFLVALTSGGGDVLASPSPQAGGTGKTEYREGLAGVDFSGLDAAGKERSLDLMNALGCDCGCGMTIAQCRVEDQTCGRSPVLANQIIDGIKAGKSDEEIVSALSPAAKTAAAPTPRPATASGPATPAPAAEFDLEGVVSRGNEEATVTLVEFADYQCPYCVRAVPVVEQLLQKYPDDLRYVFKQLPLTSIHRFAEPAARASLAAARQDKFWDMHDLLFENSRALDDASLKSYAEQLGLDVATFENDMNDPALSQAVQKDVAEASRLGVRGTPTFFINGYRVPAWDINTMSRLIDSVLRGEDIVQSIADANRAQREAAEARQRAQQARQAELASKVFTINTSDAPIRGNPDAPVTIVEFGDFQCPFCANSQPLIQQVLSAYPDQVKLAFKHLPLVSIHPNARPAAIASLAALEQGKFWEMRELLYKNYNRLTRATLNEIAQQVGLDMGAFDQAMRDEKNAQLVDGDVADSQAVGVTGTPTYFVNGKRVMQRDFATFKRMIDEALNAVKPASR